MVNKNKEIQAKSAEIHSCGKLLITGEYLILRGARGLALPTSRAQHFKAVQRSGPGISWKSYDHQGKLWFQMDWSEDGTIQSADKAVAERLIKVIDTAKVLNPSFRPDKSGFDVEMRLEFPGDWGLGSSATLIHAIATWAGVDPLELSAQTFFGSGYDVAVAMHGQPIIYHLENGVPKVELVEFQPSFHEQIHFIHLGKKQDSGKAVADFKKKRVLDSDIQMMDTLTDEVLRANTLLDLEKAIEAHNVLMERILGIPSASTVFQDYQKGAVKYLGAWGGDFMMVTGRTEDLSYFREKGFHILVPFNEMIKQA